jgi:RNA polymerase sigma-70 factor (ECF subfamily)
MIITLKEDEPEEGLNDADVSRIREQIHELPEGYRIILSLYLLEGYDHEEISQILNISSSTSRSQFSRAKKALLKNLKKKRNE